MDERRLILLRHGDAAGPAAFARDRDRLLTPAGEREAITVARRLEAHGWFPEVVLTSAAARALATALLVRSAMQLDAEPALIEALYEGGLREVQDTLAGVTQPVGTVMVVGHNPTLSSAAGVLSGARVALGTAHAALLRVSAPTWADAATLTGEWLLVAQLTP